MNLSVISFATDYYPFQGTDNFSFRRLGDHVPVVLLIPCSSYKEVNLLLSLRRFETQWRVVNMWLRRTNVYN